MDYSVDMALKRIMAVPPSERVPGLLSPNVRPTVRDSSFVTEYSTVRYALTPHGREPKGKGNAARTTFYFHLPLSSSSSISRRSAAYVYTLVTPITPYA